MPRPIKWRKVCTLPSHDQFGPIHGNAIDQPPIYMMLDEYECIRLIDLEGFTQEECAQQMGVGRTTIQSIYSEARRKLSDSLVNQKILFIKGGEYQLCDGTGSGCGRGCRRQGQGLGQGQRKGRGRGPGVL